MFLIMSTYSSEHNVWDIAAVVILVILSSVAFSVVIRRLLLYVIHKWKKKQKQVEEYLDKYFLWCLFITLILWFLIFISLTEVSSSENGQLWKPIKLILFSIFTGCFIFVLHKLDDCDDVELVKSQSNNRSIGAHWAHGAFEAYFEVIFQVWSQRVEEYEASGNHLDWRDLILICPLSCNVRGKLDDRFKRVRQKDFMRDIEYDQGANINRTYRLPVYIIGDNENAIHVSAQLPSSFGTLWEVKDTMKKELWLYHRKCFLDTLKKLFKGYPCTLLEYDDFDANTEPLDTFLRSRLNLGKEK